jgi:hypothetical protein
VCLRLCNFGKLRRRQKLFQRSGTHVHSRPATFEECAHRIYATATSFLDHGGIVELPQRRGKKIGLAVRPQPRLASNRLFK